MKFFTCQRNESKRENDNDKNVVRAEINTFLTIDPMNKPSNYRKVKPEMIVRVIKLLTIAGVD